LHTNLPNIPTGTAGLRLASSLPLQTLQTLAAKVRKWSPRAGRKQQFRASNGRSMLPSPTSLCTKHPPQLTSERWVQLSESNDVLSVGLFDAKVWVKLGKKWNSIFTKYL
jgi:hypothetical protein